MDLRKERTLKLLDQAFSDLMKEKVFEDLSISELCDRAMIRRATFYRHFPNKDAYLAFFVRTRRKDIHERIIGEGAPSSVQEYCRAMTRELVAFMVENRAMLVNLKMASTRDALFTAVAREVADNFCTLLVERGCFGELTEGERSVATHALASFYASGLFGTLAYVLDEGRPFDEDEADRLFGLVIGCLEFPCSEQAALR